MEYEWGKIEKENEKEIKLKKETKKIKGKRKKNDSLSFSCEFDLSIFCSLIHTYV